MRHRAGGWGSPLRWCRRRRGSCGPSPGTHPCRRSWPSPLPQLLMDRLGGSYVYLFLVLVRLRDGRQHVRDPLRLVDARLRDPAHNDARLVIGRVRGSEDAHLYSVDVLGGRHERRDRREGVADALPVVPLLPQGVEADLDVLLGRLAHTVSLRNSYTARGSVASGSVGSVRVVPASAITPLISIPMVVPDLPVAQAGSISTEVTLPPCAWARTRPRSSASVARRSPVSCPCASPSLAKDASRAALMRSIAAFRFWPDVSGCHAGSSSSGSTWACRSLRNEVIAAVTAVPSSAAGTTLSQAVSIRTSGAPARPSVTLTAEDTGTSSSRPSGRRAAAMTSFDEWINRSISLACVFSLTVVTLGRPGITSGAGPGCGSVAARCVGRHHCPGQRHLEVSSGHRLGEHRVVVRDRVRVLLRANAGDAVGERDDLVPTLVRRPHRRLDAAVREEARQRHGLDALAAQDEVEVRARERVEAALALEDDVAVGRCQVADDLRAPAALDEGVRVDDPLEDPVRVARDLVVAGRELDRRVDDRRASGSGRRDERLGVREHVRGVHDGLHRAVEHAPFGGEVVLVLDEHDGGLCGIHGFS